MEKGNLKAFDINRPTEFVSNITKKPKVLLLAIANAVTLPVVDGKKLKKLFVTMVIRNVSLSDDSTYGALGRYECHAFAVGDPVERKHGFSVNVIASKL